MICYLYRVNEASLSFAVTTIIDTMARLRPRGNLPWGLWDSEAGLTGAFVED